MNDNEEKHLFPNKPTSFEVLNMHFCVIQMNESIVAKTTITMPVNGGAVEAISTIETVPYWTRSRKRSGKDLDYQNKKIGF